MSRKKNKDPEKIIVNALLSFLATGIVKQLDNSPIVKHNPARPQKRRPGDYIPFEEIK